jgi:hypothetical protein
LTAFSAGSLFIHQTEDTLELVDHSLLELPNPEITEFLIRVAIVA